MSFDEPSSNTDETLWVLVNLKDTIYAINSACVEAMFMMEQEIIKLEDSSKNYPGIVPYRDKFIPVADLRCILGMDSLTEEQIAFESMIDLRKDDHIRWVDELRRCLHDKDDFTLATDPHKCAFGKWYDHYKPKSQTVAFHLKKIDEPHQKLHATAGEALACLKAFENGDESASYEDPLKKASSDYMPRVIQLLDDTKAILNSSQRRMLVVVTIKDHLYGLMVDEIVSAESLTNIRSSQSAAVGSNETQSVKYIAQRKNDNELILILDMDALFQTHSLEQMVTA